MESSQSLTGSPEPKGRSKGKIILALGIVSFSAIPGGILDIYLMLSDIQSWRFLTLLIVLFSPIIGRLAWLMANNELKTIQEAITPTSSLRVVKLGRCLGIWGTFGGTILLLMILAVSALISG